MKFSLLLPLLGISLLTLSCSGNDDTLPNTEQEPTTPVQTKHFLPPAWIQGKWINRDSPTVSHYKFTADDYIALPENKSVNDIINQSQNETLVIGVIDEYSSNKNYSFTTTTKSKTSNYYNQYRYSFIKLNDTLMVQYPDMLGPLYYVKVKE